MQKLGEILTPKVGSDPSKLGIVSKVYRFLFHFHNQVFGRFVKILVFVIFILLLQKSGDIWTKMMEGLTRMESRMSNVESLFKQIENLSHH